MYLQNLSISGFRGIGAGLDLPLTQRTILYGPNGSGKTSLLQSVAWALYGKLPAFLGGVFSKEDALVNDFLEEEKAEVVVTLSDNKTITRRRSKQDSTSKGNKPPILSFPFQTQDPQEAVEELLGLSPEEFFTAVFLHQETIRDFLTTTPEKRNATIDRMIGTSLLRILIKQVDPKVPNKSITACQEKIDLIDRTLSQATVISREMIEKKKEQYGDPITLPDVLATTLQMLTPILMELEQPVPTASLDQLRASLSNTYVAQLECANALNKKVRELQNLQQRYLNAAETNWRNVLQKKTQFGDPSELLKILKSIHKRLVPISQKLGLSSPNGTLAEQESSLDSIRQAQPTIVGQLGQKSTSLETLKARFIQASITDWQGLNQRKSTIGDPATLPSLLKEIQESFVPSLQKLGIPTPKADLSLLEACLAKARQILPGTASKLERRAGDLLALKANYLQISKEVVDETTVPKDLTARQDRLNSRFKALGKAIPILIRQQEDLTAKKEQAEHLREHVRVLPSLKEEITNQKKELARLEAVGKQGKLYNQVVDTGRQYLEQVQPDHCPVCQQSIQDIGHLIERLRSETPLDSAKLQLDHESLNNQLTQNLTRVQELESQEDQLAKLDTAISKFPPDLETEITARQNENDQLTKDISEVQIEVSEIKGRIQKAAENHQRLQETADNIKTALGDTVGPDLLAALDQAAASARQNAASLSALDFQPIANQLERARSLFEMGNEEKRLSKQLKDVMFEVKNALSPISDEDVPDSFDKAIATVLSQITEIQSLDLQPIASDLARASQLQQIQDEEKDLQQQLEAVETEIHQVLKLPVEEVNLKAALDIAIGEAQARTDRAQDIDLQPIKNELQHAEQLEEILKDEANLRDSENNNQAANREKTRLTHQISRLTELRDALQDIAETTKGHQSTIVSEVLSNLDIHHYYQLLDPHPAYTALQIEPELTDKGTYNYWIKALTEDYSHGTYVQTRFSTAQANCAAIAIFMAVNQHLSKNLETILLDDPSQSMDPEHKQRLAQTLASNPRQVIVATEDPQMYTFLKQFFESPTIYELLPWTSEGSKLSLIS
jgi:DNA repair exonuclease SbcCD ATPase subunit